MDVKRKKTQQNLFFISLTVSVCLFDLTLEGHCVVDAGYLHELSNQEIEI